MNINYYQTTAKLTAIYPPEQQIVYPTLGLIEEIGELLAICRTDRTTVNGWTKLVQKELGDCLWQLANCCEDCGLRLDALFHASTFEEGIHLLSPSPSLTVSSQRLSGLVSKMIRDDKGELTDERRERIKVVLMDIWRGLLAVCIKHGWAPSDIARLNLDKLKDRQERDVLKGDGDNR